MTTFLQKKMQKMHSEYYCENCKVWHNNDDKGLEEIWCNNCETWHLPKNESKDQIIK